MLFKFTCYIPGENPLFIVINLQSDDWVAELLKKIAVELKEKGQEVCRTDLRLFKVDVPMEPKESLQSRVIQWLHEQPPDSQLDNMSTLEAIFPNGPHPRKESKLDIIIADLEILEMVDGLGDPYDVYKRKVKKALDKCLNNCLSLPSPSDAVKDACNLAEVFGGKEPHIHIGWPGGAPAIIFNPVLATLQQSFDNLEQVKVSEHEVSLAFTYILCVVQFYNCEELHQDTIKELVNVAIRGTGDWGRSINMAPLNDIKPDQPWWHDTFPILFLELKNLLGLSGDVLFQAIVDYRKIVLRVLYQSFREYCYFPSILIGVTANRFEISITVCVGLIYVTKLLMLDLSLGFHASDNIICLACVFKVLSRHWVEIEKYYQSAKSLASPKLSCLYPNLTPINPSKPLPKLTYWEFLSRAGQPMPDILDLGNATTVMYTTTLNDTNKEVIVKFTSQLALKLHFCGHVVGDLYMIVMERVNRTSVWQLQKDNTLISEIVPTKVEEAVRLLHEQDIVFGDLQSNNILYVAFGAKAHVVLIDFDWPGKDGESRYPATLNHITDSKTWQEDVSPYHIMRKAHNLWQLD